MRIGVHTWGSEGDVRPFLPRKGLTAAKLAARVGQILASSQPRPHPSYGRG
jgi:hypothetical protein